MKPIKRVYLLIGIPLLLITIILFSPYRNWLAIQASEIGDQIFFPIVFQKEGAGPGDGMSVRIDDYTAETGDIVQVMVEAINLDNMATTTMEFSFNPAVLSPVECNKDPESQFDLHQCNIEFEEDTIRFNLTSLRGVSGDIRLAELAFEVIGENEDTSLIEIEVFTFASPLGESLEHTVRNGKFTVSAQPTPDPSGLSSYDLSQRIDVGPFVFHASDDMVEVDVQGIDSLVKVYENVEMKISLDYGWYSGYTPHSSEITLTIDGFEALYNTQEAHSNSAYKYSSVVFFENFDPVYPQNRLGMYIGSNREDAAEVALSIFKTIDFDHEAGVYPLDQQIDGGPVTFRAFEHTYEIVEARESNPLVRIYQYDHFSHMEIVMTYGDSVEDYRPTPDDPAVALTIDGFEAIYYTRQADSSSGYDYHSTVYFENVSNSESSDRFIMQIYSDREAAAEIALAIFNTIEFTGITVDLEELPTATPLPPTQPPPSVIWPEETPTATPVAPTHFKKDN